MYTCKDYSHRHQIKKNLFHKEEEHDFHDATHQRISTLLIGNIVHPGLICRPTWVQGSERNKQHKPNMHTLNILTL